MSGGTRTNLLHSHGLADDAQYETWRDAERACFEALELLRLGHIPSPTVLEGLSETALRRLGYLADLACLHLDPMPDAAWALGSLVVRIREMVPCETWAITDAVPAVPHPRKARPCNAFDMVGGWWGLLEPIDVARFQSEIPAIRIEQEWT